MDLIPLLPRRLIDSLSSTRGTGDRVAQVQ